MQNDSRRRGPVRALAWATAWMLGCGGTEFSAIGEGSGGIAAVPDSGGNPGDGGAGGMTGDAAITRDAAGAGGNARPDAGCISTTINAPCPTDPDIPTAAMTLWLSADVGVETAVGQVTGWGDRSGSGNNAAQTVTSYQPTLAPNWHGGNPAIRFDGTMRFLRLPAGFADFTQGLTLFVVADVTGDNNCPAFIEFSNGGEVDDISLHRQPGDAFEYEVLDQVATADPATQPLATASLLTVVHHTDLRADLYADGALSVERMVELPKVVQRGRSEIGRSSYAECDFLIGHVAEIILYARPLEKAERSKVEAYLRTKWAL